MKSSWGLNLFVLFEQRCDQTACRYVLEDWIYLYYLNNGCIISIWALFLRIEFICIIWTVWTSYSQRSKFLRIEFICIIWTQSTHLQCMMRSWGLNLFVLFELVSNSYGVLSVLEDWIYLYYLNPIIFLVFLSLFLRIEFICIIWTDDERLGLVCSSWGLNLFVLFERDFAWVYDSFVLEDWIYLYYLNCGMRL